VDTGRHPAKSDNMAIQQHAEHVGSLLRPPYLLAAREARDTGELTAEELRAVEDRAIAELIDIQRQAGLTVFTDGEARRESWRAGLLESLSGVIPAKRTMRWYRDGRELTEQETLNDGAIAVEKVARKGGLSGVEADFMAAHAPGPFKITMISASMAGMIWDPVRSAAVYPTIGDLTADLAQVQIEEIDDLIANHGVGWVQLDSLGYNQAIDAGHAGSVRSRVDPATALDATITTDREVVTAVQDKHPDVTFGMHICRGNYRSSWMVQGSYEPVAERLFNEVPVDRFLLEYDTERAGGFEPLRFVPTGRSGRSGPTVVLGLITTKVPRFEDRDDLLRRIDEAARHVPLEQLALSPQCGFASGSLGNLITVDDERRKLDLVVSVAREVWG
jgi:5-methyltetrahydropteroyltriglutamate--homocysteine methyltransferase